MYDNICKILAETFPADFASWLLGKSIDLAKLEPSELSAEPIRADSLIFLESPDLILHLEFQTRADENIFLRMLDYWLRLRRKFPNKEIHQIVIYLKPTNSPLVYQDKFISERTTHSFNVIRLGSNQQKYFSNTKDYYLLLSSLKLLTQRRLSDKRLNRLKPLQTKTYKQILLLLLVLFLG